MSKFSKSKKQWDKLSAMGIPIAQTLRTEDEALLHIYSCHSPLDLQFYPFLGRNEAGDAFYDYENGLKVKVDEAVAKILYLVAWSIYREQEGAKDAKLVISFKNGITLTLDRHPYTYKGFNGPIEHLATFLTITKEDVNIPFRFGVQLNLEKTNGEHSIVIFELGLDGFTALLAEFFTKDNVSWEDVVKMRDDFEANDRLVELTSYVKSTDEYQIFYNGCEVIPVKK